MLDSVSGILYTAQIFFFFNVKSTLSKILTFGVSGGCLRDSVYCPVCNNAKTIETSSVLPLEAKSALSILNFGVSWGCLEGVWRVSEGFCILSSV